MTLLDITADGILQHFSYQDNIDVYDRLSLF
jgi:hypothetical protein